VKQLWPALVTAVLMFLLFPYPHALFAPERRVPMLTPGWIEDEAWEAVTDQCPHISPELAPDIAFVRFRAFSPPGLRQLSMDGVGGGFRVRGGDPAAGGAPMKHLWSALAAAALLLPMHAMTPATASREAVCGRSVVPCLTVEPSVVLPSFTPHRSCPPSAPPGSPA
jgi:hypothetical protein